MEVVPIDFKNDMLNYKWFTGNDHRMHKINIGSIGLHEVITLRGKCTRGTKFMSIGCLTNKNSRLTTVSNNVRRFDSGEFCVIFGKNYFYTRKVSEDIGPLANDVASGELFLHNGEDILIFIDQYGGRLEELSATKYSFDRNALFFVARLPEVFFRGLRLEYDSFPKENLVKSINKCLMKDLKKVISGYDVKPINISECSDTLSASRGNAFLPQSNLTDGNGLYNDVTRFVTPEIGADEGEISIFFIDHKKYDKGLYNRISIIDKRGNELKYFEPSAANECGEGLHTETFKVTSSVQIVESVFCENTDSLLSPHASTVYPMFVLKTEPIITCAPYSGE